MKLTESQRKLVEDNHNFIYYFLKKHNLRIDDWYDTCAIGMCNAAMNFQPEQGFRFITFANTCLLNEIRQAKRKQKSKRRNAECYSLDQVVPGTDDLTLTDMLASPEGLEDRVLQRVELRQGLESLSERERTVLLMLACSEVPQRVVAAHFGKSQGWVSRILTGVKKKLMQEVDG